MATTSEVPVLIVGGGAVGSVLSMELARRGIAYRCIDRMSGPGRESRAIALHARTIELMNLVDPGLSSKMLDRDLWCRGYVMHFLRDGERRVDVPSGAAGGEYVMAADDAHVTERRTGPLRSPVRPPSGVSLANSRGVERCRQRKKGRSTRGAPARLGAVGGSSLLWRRFVGVPWGSAR